MKQLHNEKAQAACYNALNTMWA